MDQEGNTLGIGLETTLDKVVTSNTTQKFGITVGRVNCSNETALCEGKHIVLNKLYFVIIE